MRIAIAILGLTLSTLSIHAQSITTNKAKDMTQKEQVVALLKSIETGDTAPVAFINAEKYTQHNLAIKDGLAGFGEALGALPKGSARVNTVRVFQDGDYVFTHTDYNFFGEKIGFDVFRFENGLIVEHWDNLAETAQKPNPSGHSMIDGTLELTDLEKTAENKNIVKSFVHDILMGNALEKLVSYFDGDHYIQHNPQIADGLSGLGAALEAMARQGIEMKYTTLHKVLGEGNFVLTINEGYLAGEHVAYYDLFRVQQGKIAEHWDVIERILPEKEWQNSNGKFGF